MAASASPTSTDRIQTALRSRLAIESATFADALELLDDLLASFLARGERELWDFLTALRGPDRRRDRRAFKKHEVTAAIRGLGLPNTAAVLAGLGKRNGKRRSGPRPTFSTRLTPKQALELLLEHGKGGHWAIHAARALDALERWRPHDR